MHWIDLAALCILGFCALLGLVRGFLVEVLGALALAIAVFITLAVVDAVFPAVRDSELVKGAVPAPIQHVGGWDNWLKLLIYLAGFAAAKLVPGVLSSTFGMQAGFGRVSFPGRLLGGAVGVAKGGAYLAAAYLLAGLVLPPADWPDSLKGARSLPVIREAIGEAAQVLPANLRPDLREAGRKG